MEVTVTVDLNPQELILFRRALAKEADKQMAEGKPTPMALLQRICELDLLRCEAEEKAAGKFPPSPAQTAKNVKLALHRLTQ